ncbi:MAG: PDZ domain-containing protein, partial [Gemmataceae bacterium]|nr:PDZ domain-containing protein [Gemmataceae bacterium]
MHAPRCRTPRRLLAGLAILGLALWLPLAGTFGQQTPPKPTGEAAAVARGPTDATLPAGWVKALTWRSIGPANMGGRITALSVYEADPSRFHVATASGGLLRTTNNGTTFQHQFDREATVSIGDVCIAPSDPNIVWVGTGENNPRNSVSYGDGVYKSTDGGKTWKNMGLKQTFQIGRLAIHPKNPNVVYVGALGRLYGPNPERGLFKTTDGGRTWQKILYFDENTGVIDIAMHPADPDTLLVAMWERRRDGFDSYLGGTPPDGYDVYDPITRWGPHAGIYKTTDGGATFKKMTTGLPTSHLGRISLDYFRKDPNVVYAVVDCAKIGMGTPPKVVAAQPYLGGAGEDGEPGARLTVVADGGPAAKAGLTVGDVIVAINKVPIDSYYDLLDQIAEFKAGDKARVRFMRDQQAR